MPPPPPVEAVPIPIAEIVPQHGVYKEEKRRESAKGVVELQDAVKPSKIGKKEEARAAFLEEVTQPLSEPSPKQPEGVMASDSDSFELNRSLSDFKNSDDEKKRSVQ